MGWRRARSLVVLGDEIHAVSPETVIYDIGDVKHQAGRSDHNPTDDDDNPETPDVVCAIDIMEGHIDLAELVQQIIASGHPDLVYVIYDRKIYHRRNNFEPEDYNGSDPHINHAHVSVGTGHDGSREQPFDDTDPWGVDMSLTKTEHAWLESINGRLYALTQGTETVEWGNQKGEPVALVKRVNELAARVEAMKAPAAVDMDKLADLLLDKFLAKLGK